MRLSKQWNRGGTLHSTSWSVRRIQSPIDSALLSRLWCVSETAFGYPVVPLQVECRLVRSSSHGR